MGNKRTKTRRPKQATNKSSAQKGGTMSFDEPKSQSQSKKPKKKS